MTPFLLTTGIIALAAATALTGLVRRYALTHALIDYPNERSSHSTPTPRGGGLAIVIVTIAGLEALTLAGYVQLNVATALIGGGALIAWVGWLDDRRGLSARVRLTVHVLAAVWTVYWLGGMPYLHVSAREVDLGLVGSMLAILGIVWAVNLYNFMDGIDGLAASEAVTVGLAAAVLLAGQNPSLAALALLVAAAAGGFLLWNWAPARIFMGDIGSGFLGYQFAALAVASENGRGGLPALVWLLLLGVFFTDTTVTLLRKMARGERWYAAHRSHAYQRVLQGRWSHQQVATVVFGLNVGLALLAWMVVSKPSLMGTAWTLGAVVLGSVYLLVEWKHPISGEPRNARAPSPWVGTPAHQADVPGDG